MLKIKRQSFSQRISRAGWWRAAVRFEVRFDFRRVDKPLRSVIKTSNNCINNSNNNSSWLLYYTNVAIALACKKNCRIAASLIF